MELVRDLETKIARWLKPLPHLPTDWRKWLAKNAWWISLVGVILSIFGLVGVTFALLAAMSIFGTTATVTSIYGYSVAPVYTGWWMLATFVSMIFLVLTTVLTAMAIKPLRAMNKKGWDYIFIAFLISVLSNVVSAVLNFDAVSFVFNLIGAAISAVVGAYFLYEIRAYFKQVAVKVSK